MNYVLLIVFILMPQLLFSLHKVSRVPTLSQLSLNAHLKTADSTHSFSHFNEIVIGDTVNDEIAGAITVGLFLYGSLEHDKKDLLIKSFTSRSQGDALCGSADFFLSLGKILQKFPQRTDKTMQLTQVPLQITDLITRAVKADQLWLADFLLVHFSSKQSTPLGESLMTIAVRTKSIAMVRLLLAHDVHEELRINQMYTLPLFIAAIQGREDIVNELIGGGYDVNQIYEKKGRKCTLLDYLEAKFSRLAGGKKSLYASFLSTLLQEEDKKPSREKLVYKHEQAISLLKKNGAQKFIELEESKISSQLIVKIRAKKEN